MPVGRQFGEVVDFEGKSGPSPLFLLYSDICLPIEELESLQAFVGGSEPLFLCYDVAASS